MTQDQFYMALLLSVVMTILGVRELASRHLTTGVWMIAIPTCFWISRLVVWP
jgi:hypothetical protein